jgi:pantoate kinase
MTHENRIVKEAEDFARILGKTIDGLSEAAERAPSIDMKAFFLGQRTTIVAFVNSLVEQAKMHQRTLNELN